jgi:hypothetical protein
MPGMNFKFRRTNHTAHQAGAGCLIPFSLVWMAFSSVFVYLGLLGSAEKDHADWEKVPCVIEKFEITDDPRQKEAFGVDLEFRYTYRGAAFTGTKTDKDDREYRADDYHELLEQRSEIMAEPEAECLVHTQDPSRAILRPGQSGDRLGGVIFAIFGSCFFLIGAGLFVSAIRQMRRSKREAAGRISVTTTSKEETPRLILFPFFTVFALAGAGILFGLIVPMWANWWSAKSWAEVPGEVIWSRIKTHKGDDSTTYSAHVFYRYEFGGTTHRSDRYSFSKVNGSHASAREKLANYPAGATVSVFVDPEHPEKSILRRELGGAAWFSLFPLPFLAVGFGGLFWLLRGGGKKGRTSATGGQRKSGRTPDNTMPGLSTLAPGESLRLAPGKGRLLKVVGVLFAAAFWNGIVSVFLVHLIKDWGNGGFSWFLAVFLTPFVLIGLGLIAAFLHQLGALFNPRPVLHLDSGQPRLGTTMTVRWEIPSGAGRLKSLKIILRGEEVATYRRGTNSVTERSTFHEAEILSTEMMEMMRAGRGSTRLPAELVPSWKSSNNRIEWSLRVEGSIALWPDISDTHSIEVLPS